MYSREALWEADVNVTDFNAERSKLSNVEDATVARVAPSTQPGTSNEESPSKQAQTCDAGDAELPSILPCHQTETPPHTHHAPTGSGYNRYNKAHPARNLHDEQNSPSPVQLLVLCTEL
ncbi:MAG: hypothetical protein Q9179_006770 [Wetmoreana sp. 5 TL-2023]